MSKESLVFEVTDASYGKYVMLNSHKVPVLMMFSGVWSEHCFVLDNILTDLATEFAEEFIYAKIDIDENAESKQKYEIANVPTIIVFKGGEPVRREEGLLTKDELRALLKDYGVYRESDEMRLQARQHHMQGETPQAITLLAEAMQKDPANTYIAMDMVQIFIDLGQLEEADSLLSKLPQADRDSETGTGLVGQIWAHIQAAKTDGVEKLAQRIATDESDFDAHFDMAVCEMAANNYPEAMSHLFTIQQHQAEYREGAAREMIVSLVNTLAQRNPEMAQLYRRQLASMLNE